MFKNIDDIKPTDGKRYLILGDNGWLDVGVWFDLNPEDLRLVKTFYKKPLDENDILYEYENALYETHCRYAAAAKLRIDNNIGAGFYKWDDDFGRHMCIGEIKYYSEIPPLPDGVNEWRDF